MKVGSLVQCLVGKWQDSISSITYPQYGEIYVIREFYNYGTKRGVFLEEIINEPVDSKLGEHGEPCFAEHAFVELQPPTHIDINELLNM